MKMSSLLVLSFAAATLLAAQDTKPAADPPAKPADPKVPTHSPEQSALNKGKEEVRQNDKLKKSLSKLQKAVQDTGAAKKEVERAEKGKVIPSTDEAKKKLEDAVKNNLDKKDLKELENKLREGVKEGTKALRERNKKEGDGNTPPANPTPDADTPPGSFDKSAKEESLPVRKGPVFQPAPISAEVMISGIMKDPKKPEVDLPKSDPRTRTFVLNGNAKLRQPDIVLDADEVELLVKEGRAPGSGSKTKKPPTSDPVKPEAAKGAPIERLIARGRVRFMFVDKDGHVQAGRCGNLIYEEKTGWFILKDWPEVEAEGYLIRGPKKDSIMRLSRTEKSDLRDCIISPVDRELNTGDVPKDRDTPVPAARPERSKP
jgi:lipopolysaccharide export system protein LptA